MASVAFRGHERRLETRTRKQTGLMECLRSLYGVFTAVFTGLYGVSTESLLSLYGVCTGSLRIRHGLSTWQTERRLQNHNLSRQAKGMASKKKGRRHGGRIHQATAPCHAAQRDQKTHELSQPTNRSTRQAKGMAPKKTLDQPKARRPHQARKAKEQKTPEPDPINQQIWQAKGMAPKQKERTKQASQRRVHKTTGSKVKWRMNFGRITTVSLFESRFSRPLNMREALGSIPNASIWHLLEATREKSMLHTWDY